MAPATRLFIGLATLAGLALAQAQTTTQPPPRANVPASPREPVTAPPMGAGMDRADAREELADARETVQEAVQVVQRMKAQPGMAQTLARARGVFIVTDYGRAAAGIGVQGGEGVLVTRQGQEFGNPVFYNFGGVSVGPQIGASAGPVAFLLMTDQAVNRFASDRNFSLSASAGLTVAPWSARAMAATGKISDVLVWSGTAGAYAGANLGIEGVVVDSEANRAYYGRRDATPAQILGGRVTHPHNDVLGMVLSI